MLKRVTYLIPLFVGLAIAAVIATGYFAEQERHLQKTQLQVFYKLSTIQGEFENTLNTKLHLATALKSFISLNPNINQEEFTILANALTTNVNGIRFLELARDNVITHVFPNTGSDLVLGRDLMKDFPTDIKDMTLRAMATRQSQISTPKAIIEGGDAIIVESPVYRNDGKVLYWGTVMVLIDTNSLYREAGLTDTLPGLEIALRKPGSDTSLGNMLIGKQSVFNRNPIVMNIPIPNGYWQLAAIPVGGWPPSPYRMYFIVGGTIGTLLIIIILWATLSMIHGRIDTRERYRYLVHNAKSIILRIDMAGKITFCNEHANAFYGYEHGELIGKHLIGTLIPKKDLEGKSMKRYINRLIKNPSAHPFNENINVRKNGERVWVAWANDSVMDRDGNMIELLCIGTDITDRKLMEEALRQSEKQYRLLAENVTDIIWGLDTDSHFTFISPSDEVVRGFKRHDVLSRPIGDFLTPASDRKLSHTMKALENLATSQDPPPSETLDLEFICSNGSTIWLETHLGILLNEDGEKIGMQGVSRDISDRKLAEALRDDVERMARHDLKTPLGAVVGLPGEIRRLGDLTKAQESMLSTIEDAGNTMLHLINRSLDLFKMECGTYILKKKTVDILNILEQIKTETRPVMREKGISVGIEIQGTTSDKFLATVEEDLFKSMLSNLIINAIQASPEGGSISIVMERDKDVCRITICNHGEVAKPLRDVFFDKYSSSNESAGSGLGTYSARLIARTHGGEIKVNTSQPGKTCVSVTLP